MNRRRDPHRRDRSQPDMATLEATRELVEEILLTALALDAVMTALLAEIPDGAFPGEENIEVLLQMVVGSARPSVRAAGIREAQTATALVVALRERVLTDLHTAAELAPDPDCPPSSKTEK
jgi:hypothetical protein